MPPPSTITWAGRLAALGAAANEIQAIDAGYLAAGASQQRALNELVAGIDNMGLLTMLTLWRGGAGPFGAGYPGGGLPFGAHAAVVSGSPSDDAYALTAGTGTKLSLSGQFQGNFQSGIQFKTGDVTVFNGQLYTCTTPHLSTGSFVAANFTAVGAQGELAYAEITANFTAATSGLTLQDVTGLQVTAACTGRPIMVEAFAPQFGYSGTPSGSAFAIMSLFDVTGSIEVSRAIIGGPAGGVSNPVAPKRRLAPAAGNRTFKMQIEAAAGLTPQVLASTTFPAFLRVVEF